MKTKAGLTYVGDLLSDHARTQWIAILLLLGFVVYRLAREAIEVGEVERGA